MQITDFESRHIPEAQSLALAAYREARSFSPALPELDSVPDLLPFAENHLGAAALENGKLVGFLCCVPPFPHVFRSTDAVGVFSPMGVNAAVKENRAKIYAALYQAAGAKWVKAGAVSHALCLYAHDEALQRQFYTYGFGQRTADAIRPMTPIDAPPCPDYTFSLLSREERPAVYELERALHAHYLESPFFMNRPVESLEAFLESAEKENRQFFGAKRGEELCAFLSVSPFGGETFAASGDSYRHINGAYCEPAHRGKGVYQNLLNCCIVSLREEGVTRLGVDFESINPAAMGFWRKYFSIYTHGVVRRIDEKILERSDFQ